MGERNMATILFSATAGIAHSLLITSAVLEHNYGRLGYAGLNVLACLIVFVSAAGLVAHAAPTAGTTLLQRLRHPFVFPLDASFALALPGSISLMISGFNAEGTLLSQLMESASGLCVLTALLSGLFLPAERVWKIGPVAISSLALPAVLFWASTLSLLASGWESGNIWMTVAALLFCVANTILATLKKA